MKQCQRCDIVATQNLTATDIVSGSTATKVGSTITANASKANSAFFDNDSIMTGAANILRAQRKQGWVVLGGEGTTKAFQMVRDGEVDALFVIDNTMNGFCSVFLMNQVFAGTKLVPCGLGFTIVDKEHNLPPEGEKFTPSLDFRSIYMKQWSGS